MERVALTEAEKWKPEQTELERGTVNRNARWGWKERFCSDPRKALDGTLSN